MGIITGVSNSLLIMVVILEEQKDDNQSDISTSDTLPSIEEGEGRSLLSFDVFFFFFSV